MFGLPSMLWWGLGAAVPILIHLFARQRFRRVSWAAMDFLRRAFQKTKRRIRLENLLILLLRVAAIALLALALAEPRLKSSLLSAGADARREVVVVVDNSFSMGFREASGETPFRRAHDQALKLVRNLKPERGDTATLILGGRPATLVLSRTTDVDRVVAEIDKVEISDAATDLVGALRVVVSVLEGAPRGAEIFVLTDLQKIALMPPDEAGERADAARETASKPSDSLARPSQILGTLLDQIKLRGGKVAVVPTGSGDADNLVVSDIRLTSKAAVVNQPIRFSATVKNFGQRPASGVLNLFVDGSEGGVESQTIELLSPGDTYAADFQHTFREAGPHEVDVRFTTDALEIDNRRALSTLVENRLAVLVVDGSADREPGEEASFFLKTALELGASATRPPVFQVKAVNEVAFDRENLAEWDLVVLADVRNVSERRATEIEEFVARGGGLLTFLGERTSPAINDALHRGGKGVLPAAIGTTVGELNTRQPAFEVQPLVVDRPPLQYFADEKIRAALIGVPIYRFGTVALPEGATDVKVLAQFVSHKATTAPPAPAIVEKAFGRGRSILVTTTANREWNELAVFPTFVPFVREMAYHLVRRAERFENLMVGDSYRRDLDQFVQEIVVERGGKQLNVIKPTPLVGTKGFEFKVDGLDRSGVYKLSYVGPPESADKPLVPTYLAVNVDPRESDLARIKPDALSGLFLADQLKVLESVDADRGDRAEPDERAWWWILLVVLGAMVAETALAQWFGRAGRGGAP